ncbi:MAG TPA: hypothetical protein DC049_06835 [Spirochaetia bacterium]|nr:hypothetical protein [Spirochaetia bacterium]
MSDNMVYILFYFFLCEFIFLFYLPRNKSHPLCLSFLIKNRIIIPLLRKHPLRTKRSVNIRSVARQASVSPATVSRVLNKEQNVKKKTHDQVLSIIKASGYSFKPGLAQKKHIAVLYNNAASLAQNYYLPPLLANCEKHLVRNNYSVVFISSANFDYINELQFHGFISLVHNRSTFDKIMQFTGHAPLVAINSAYSHSCLKKVSFVYSDHSQSVRLALDYLAGLGHNKTGMISLRYQNDTLSFERLKTYLDYCRKTIGKTKPNTYLFLCDDNTIGNAVADALQAGCTALIASSETCSLKIPHFLAQYNVRIPDDISLVTFELPGISEFLSPPLTSIRQPIEKMSEKAVELMLQYLTGAKNIEKNIKFDNNLIFRSSVKPLFR